MFRAPIERQSMSGWPAAGSVTNGRPIASMADDSELRGGRRSAFIVLIGKPLAQNKARHAGQDHQRHGPPEQRVDRLLRARSETAQAPTSLSAASSARCWRICAAASRATPAGTRMRYSDAQRSVSALNSSNWWIWASMPRPTSSSVKKPASARLVTRATSIQGRSHLAARQRHNEGKFRG